MNPATGPFYFVFLAVFLAGIGVFFFRIRGKWLLLRRAAPADCFNQPRRRLGAILAQVAGQRRILHDPTTGLMHAFIFWGFCILAIHTTSLFLGSLIPPLAFERALGTWYAWPKDIFIILVTLAIIYAVIRRSIWRPFRVENSGEAYLVLGLIFLLMATDIATEAAMVAGGGISHGFLGAALAPLLAGWSPAGINAFHATNWWLQAVTILFFLNLLPGSKHFHVITAVPNVYFQNLDRPGRAATLDLEDEDAETFGTSRIQELDWKLMLDVFTCTECGRCHEFCPTHTTDKPLSPKRMNDHIKHFAYDNQATIGAGKADELPDLFEAEVIGHDEIWACTTCRFCETACPLFIEEVPWIMNFRRYQTLMESNFPEELTKAFKGMENNSNPWGIGAHRRGEWASELNIPLATESDNYEYLFFVGCSGSFDDRNKKISVAFARLLQTAGISFAILGEAEGCCGDAARRTGNEYLFQMLAQANIETFKEAGVKKIVTTCPHGYNILKNEYPELGGTFEVYHHTELLDTLLRDGRLRPTRPLPGQVAFHDSCYLGRYNEVYAEPRNVLRRVEKLELKELELHHHRGYCCGGGGGRVFMEETLGTRINHHRIEQVRKSGCDTVAAACPFCMTMLSDGVNEKELEGVQVKDIAEILLEAVTDEAAGT